MPNGSVRAASAGSAPPSAAEATSAVVRSVPRPRWCALLGWTAIVASIAYFLSDVLEVTHGGFSRGQLWLTLFAEAAIPVIVVGLFVFQRAAFGRLGRWSAFTYAYTFVYFTFTVAYALANDTPDFERLTRALDPGMTLHGVAMVGAGATFGYAIAKAGVLPKWTGALLGIGVLLVALTVGRAPVLELTAVAVRDVAIAAMGVAILLPGRRQA